MTGAELSLSLTVADDLETAERRIRELLGTEGFGVLTEIDVQATLRSKIGVEIDGYRILGACNPRLANRAIAGDPTAGVLLPCNVVLRTVAEGTRVDIANPLAMLELLDNPELRAVAEEARDALDRVAAAMSERSERLPAG